MTNVALIKVDPKQYGLDETQAREVERAFVPMLEKMVALEESYNEIVNLPISPEACQKARELRLEYVRVRTGTAKIHKAAKAYYLAGGRFVDGWKNAQHFASQGKEEKLRAIEDYYENLEKERIARLQEERSAQIAQYESGYIPPDLGSMDESVWSNYLAGVKLAHEQRIAAEKAVEEERIAKEKAETEDRARIKAENERLKAEAEDRKKAEEEERKEIEAYRKKVEEQLRKEREAQEAIRKEKELAEQEAEARLQKAKEDQERLEAELRAKVQAEAAARKEAEEKLLAQQRAEEEAKKAEEEAKRQADRATDADKLVELSKVVRTIDLPECSSKIAQAVVVSAKQSLEELGDWILGEANFLD